MTEVSILKMGKYCKGNIEVLPDDEAQELINTKFAIRSFIHGGLVNSINSDAILDNQANEKESFIDLKLLDDTIKKK